MIREPWIRVHANLAAKPVVTRMAEALHIDPFKAMGHLVAFWSGVAGNAKNGHIADVPDALLERWAGWNGRRGRFAAWVRSDHMDADGRVNEWDTYQGKLETKRALERERQRRSRGRHADNEPKNGVTSRVRHANHTRDVGTPTRERNGTKYRSPSNSGEERAALDGAAAAGQDPNRARNEAELAESNRLRKVRGERPLAYGEVYSDG